MSIEPWPLSWISHEKLRQIVRTLIEEGRPKSAGLNHSNIVDPFSAVFDMAVNGMTMEEWTKAEIRRQHQKTLQNAIGKFHQTVLGSVEGWVDKGVGNVFDLQCDSRKIFAEVKNKFNTVKGSDKIDIYNKMARWRGADPAHYEYTGYYVQILTKKPFNQLFVPSDNTTKNKAAENKYIREIDGASFYALVTGSETALHDLYRVLPAVLSEVIPEFKGHELDHSADFEKLFTEAFHKNK